MTKQHAAATASKGIVETFLSRRRIGRSTCEKVSEGRVQVAQRPLLAGARYAFNPIELVSQERQFAGLGRKADVVPGLAFELPPEIASLLPREIVDQPAHSGGRLNKPRLLWRRVKSVSEGTKHRAATITQFGKE